MDLLRRCGDPVPLNNNLILTVEEEVDLALSADFEKSVLFGEFRD